MKLAKNTFKTKLEERKKPLYGLWLGLSDPIATEISAVAGFDWLLIDNEHAPIELPQILLQLQVLAAYASAIIVRPASHDSTTLKKLMDIGVQNFLVPMVETADEVDCLAEALLYPPHGKRGLGTSLARAARWNNIEDYVARANEEVCLLIQVESVRGLQNLDELLSKDIVSAVFIGPSDLAADMGFLGKPEHQEVVSAVSQALQQITKAGKAAGVLVGRQELARYYAEQGANFIGLGSDTALLASATRALSETNKQ